MVLTAFVHGVPIDTYGVGKVAQVAQKVSEHRCQFLGFESDRPGVRDQPFGGVGRSDTVVLYLGVEGLAEARTLAPLDRCMEFFRRLDAGQSLGLVLDSCVEHVVYLSFWRLTTRWVCSAVRPTGRYGWREPGMVRHARGRGRWRHR